jgi:hypothetical protein
MAGPFENRSGFQTVKFYNKDFVSLYMKWSRLDLKAELQKAKYSDVSGLHMFGD